ncbi:hypothetical protein [Labrys sp. ZIDIC5]|uniref:hypothetical protein n=1 Tax=Labrys sedimenti TaxID=3106036 RepID=UPI002ACABB53|nr:hypothetical protein [Labrys sp. ZIDIC5]MDZ5454371.1 hypothetical protein [Labrys sp. ZIDIC5]
MKTCVHERMAGLYRSDLETMFAYSDGRLFDRPDSAIRWERGEFTMERRVYIYIRMELDRLEIHSDEIEELHRARAEQ